MVRSPRGRRLAERCQLPERAVRPVLVVCAGINRHGEGEEGALHRRRELYIEGVAIHGGPESCVGVREGAGEALTGVRVGWAIEPRNES
jgi:hypothetical protein